MLENINNGIDSFSSTIKNQLSFNKMLETQIAQLASALPNQNLGKLSRQPKPAPKEHLNVVTTRCWKSTQDPPNPNHAGKKQEEVIEEAEEEKCEEEEDQPPVGGKVAPKPSPKEFLDTTLLPFSLCQRKAAANNQFGKFVEVIKKLYVNIPLRDDMQVPIYAKYLKDILNNKKPLPTMEVVDLTEECGAAILN